MTETPAAGDSTDKTNATNIDEIPVDPSEAEDADDESIMKWAIRWGIIVACALVITFLVQAFLFQPFRIPSDSMVPTLKNGDRIVVNKVSYEIHRVHRGDVVVFTTPTCASPDSPTWAQCGGLYNLKDLVKRVVALPGEHIYITDNKVFINGQPLVEPYVRHGAPIAPQPPGCAFSGTKAQPYVVPQKMVFVMGDNRDNSYDSRCFGPIPEKSIVGKAFVKIWPVNRIGGL